MGNYSHFRDVLKFLSGNADEPDHLRISAFDSSVYIEPSAKDSDTLLIAETVPPDRATPVDDGLARPHGSFETPDATTCHGPHTGAHHREGFADHDRALVVRDRQDGPQSFNQPNSTAIRDRYEQNNERLKSNIHAVAGALTTLDAIENKLLLMRADITGLVSSGHPLNRDNVELALRRVAQYINDAIETVDSECVNLLRDARMEIRFTQLDSPEVRTSSIHLTMISPQKFLDRKLAGTARERIDEQAVPDFIDGIHRIVASNIQTLSSVLLVLFATRDYTEAVTQLAQREGIIPRLGNASPTLAAPTLDQLRYPLEGSNDGNLEQGRASLIGLLESAHPELGVDSVASRTSPRGVPPDATPDASLDAPPDALYVDRIALAVCRAHEPSNA